MQPQKPAATGHALLSHKKLRLTDRMDFKGTVGAIWTWNPRSSRPWNLVRRHYCQPATCDAQRTLCVPYVSRVLPNA